MTQRSQELIDQLTRAAWFSQVGCPSDRPDVLWLGSWVEAQSHIASYWKDRRYVPPVNRIRYLLRERCSERFHGWNVVADTVREPIIALVDTKTEGLMADPAELKLIRDMLGWDVMHACMESEFADECHIRYHRARTDLLMAGHCPCAWQGEYPDGQHIAL